MQADKLVRMANQIATFFDSQPGDGAAAVARHLNDFWDPRMRRAFLAIIAAEGAEAAALHPLARAAAPLLRAPA